MHYAAPGIACQERFASRWDDLRPHDIVLAMRHVREFLRPLVRVRLDSTA